MTEKRFTTDYNGDEHLLTHFLDNGKPLTKQEVIKLLNTFNEENQQLKKENHQLKQLIQAIISKEFEISSEDNDYDALTEFFKNEVNISQIEVDIDVEKEEREY